MTGCASVSGVRWGCRWPVVIGCSVSATLLVGVTLHPNAYAAAIGGLHSGAAFGLMNTGANLMGFVNALLLSALFILPARADRQMDQAD